jgi:FkbM family methyltransferase
MAGVLESTLRAIKARVRPPAPGPAYDRRLYQALHDLRAWAPGDVVFDVGANDGRTVQRLQAHLPEPAIFAFEPVSSTFQLLTERTADQANVRCLRLALGSEAGQRQMFLNETAAVHSLDPGWGASTGTETIEMTTVDLVVAQEGIPRIDLLKIDAEGHDLEVLKGARDTLGNGKIGIVMIEVGFAAPGKRQPTLEEVQAFLSPLGHHLYGIYNQSRARLSRRIDAPPGDADPEILVYADALFVAARGA